MIVFMLELFGNGDPLTICSCCLTKSVFCKGIAPLGDPSFHLILEHHNGLVMAWSLGVDFTRA